MKPKHARHLIFPALILAESMATPHAHAASQTWDGGSVVNGNWSMVGNWVGDPTARDATSGTTNIDVATFWDTAQSWTNIYSTDGTAGTAFTDWANIFSSTVSVVNSGFTPITSVDGSFTLTGSNLSWSAVPEPSSAQAGLLLAAGLLRRRRSA